MIYFGARYLNPQLGRWISADPLAVHAPGKADLNLYAYVHGRVLVAVDPVGLQEAAPAASDSPPAIDQSCGCYHVTIRGTPRQAGSPAPESAGSSETARSYAAGVLAGAAREVVGATPPGLIQTDPRAYASGQDVGKSAGITLKLYGGGRLAVTMLRVLTGGGLGGISVGGAGTATATAVESAVAARAVVGAGVLAGIAIGVPVLAAMTGKPDTDTGKGGPAPASKATPPSGEAPAPPAEAKPPPTPREMARQAGSELVKSYKDQGAGTGAGRSGGHGTPFQRAGAELIRQANQLPKDDPLRDALKVEGNRLINQGKSPTIAPAERPTTGLQDYNSQRNSCWPDDRCSST